MNRLLPKVLIFLTFFGSCICIGLLLSALVTNCWIQSSVSFISPTSGNATLRSQHGSIQLGLFNYQKSLNHGYGMRNENFSILNIIKAEEEFMDYYLWLFTALGAGLSLFASAVGAIASVIGSIKKKGGMALMVVSNAIAGIGQIIAFVCWILQFYQYFQHNVLLRDEQKRWSSSGQTSFGYSFFFIIFAFVIVIINLILLLSAARIEKAWSQSRRKKAIRSCCINSFNVTNRSDERFKEIFLKPWTY
jgi:clarin